MSFDCGTPWISLSVVSLCRKKRSEYRYYFVSKSRSIIKFDSQTVFLFCQTKQSLARDMLTAWLTIVYKTWQRSLAMKVFSLNNV